MNTNPNPNAAGLDPEATSAMRPPEPPEKPWPQRQPAEGHAATLVVVRGPDQGKRYGVRAGSTTLGRGRGCEIMLDDVTVSREHAEIRHDSDRFTLIDKGSLNGTYLNRTAVDQSELAEGDEVWIGKFRLRFELGGSA